MGAVHKETPAQNIGVHEFESVSLSDPRCIAHLVKHREEIYPSDKSQFHFSELMSCIYLDLDALVDDTKLTRNEHWTVEIMMTGYSIPDIVASYGLSYQTVHTWFRRACIKMAKHNSENSTRIMLENANLLKICEM